MMKNKGYVSIPSLKADHDLRDIVILSTNNDESDAATGRRSKSVLVQILACTIFVSLGMAMLCHSSNSHDMNMQHGLFRGIMHGMNMQKDVVIQVDIPTKGMPPTLLSGGGRDWSLNIDEKTISPKHNSTFVLGSHPMTPLVLTNRGQSNQIVFPTEELKALKEGKSVSLSGIGLQYPNEDMKTYGGWFYTEAGSTQDTSMTVEYVDNNFIVTKDTTTGLDTVLEVSFWKYDIGNTVNFVRSPEENDDNDKHWWDKFFKKKTFIYNGGRDWIINEDDGTISPKHAPYLTLGYGPSRLILTSKDSPAAHKYDNLDALANGESTTLTFGGGSKCLGKMYTDEKYTGPWRFIESEIMSASAGDCVPFKYVDENYIATAEEGVDPEKALVLDIAFWAVVYGNSVNYVGGWTYE